MQAINFYGFVFPQLGLSQILRNVRHSGLGFYSSARAHTFNNSWALLPTTTVPSLDSLTEVFD